VISGSLYIRWLGVQERWVVFLYI